MDVYHINSKNIKLKNIGFELKRKSTTIEPSILIIQTHSQQFVIRSSMCYLSDELVSIEIRATPSPIATPLSKRTHTLWSSNLLLHQIKGNPAIPKSLNPHHSGMSRNYSSYLSNQSISTIACPLAIVILLKSLIQTHEEFIVDRG